MALLRQIIDQSNEDRDTLSGEAVKHVKRARLILTSARAQEEETSPASLAG